MSSGDESGEDVGAVMKLMDKCLLEAYRRRPENQEDEGLPGATIKGKLVCEGKRFE